MPSAARRPSSCGCSPSRKRSRPRGSSPAATSAGPPTATTAAPPRRPTSSPPSPPRSPTRSRRRTDGRTPATRCALVGPRPDLWRERPTRRRGRRGDHRGGRRRGVAARRALRPWCSRYRPLRSDRPAPGRRCSGSSSRSALRSCVPTRAPPRSGGSPRCCSTAATPPTPTRRDRSRSKRSPARCPRHAAGRRRRRRPALPPTRRGPRHHGPRPRYRRRRHRAGRRTLQPGRGARRDVRTDPGPAGPGPADRGRLPGRHSRPGPAARPAALDRSGTGAGTGRRGVRALAAQRRRPQCRRGHRAATHRGPPDARGAAHRRLRRRPLAGHVPGTGLRRAVDGRLRRARGGPAAQPAARPRRHVQLDGQGGPGRHRGATGPHPCHRGGRRRGRRTGGPAAGRRVRALALPGRHAGRVHRGRAGGAPRRGARHRAGRARPRAAGRRHAHCSAR